MATRYTLVDGCEWVKNAEYEAEISALLAVQGELAKMIPERLACFGVLCTTTTPEEYIAEATRRAGAAEGGKK